MPSDDSTRNLTPPTAIPGVVDVHWIDGAAADPTAVPDLLVEVPHGADRRAHYDALAGRLRGTYPEDLHVFFHVNTDVGAYQVGRRAAEQVVAAHPERRAVVLRCLVPRTFIDCNRVTGGEIGNLKTARMTRAMPPYVRDPADRALLLELHGRYVAVAEAAYDWVCGAGGMALNPHTYGPRTLAVSEVTERIVEDLRQAHTPEVYEASSLRPEVDLIMRTQEGEYLGPDGAEEALVEAYAAEGLTAAVSRTYTLHRVTQGFRFSSAHPGRVIGLELRRDLLVEDWLPFEEQVIDDDAITRAARPLAQVVASGW